MAKRPAFASNYDIKVDREISTTIINKVSTQSCTVISGVPAHLCTPITVTKINHGVLFLYRT